MGKDSEKIHSGCCLQFCLEGSCPCSLFDSSYFSSSPCATGTLQVLSRCWSPERVNLSKSMCRMRPFKGRSLRIPQFILPAQPLLVFTARLMGAYLPGTGTLGSGVRLGSLASKIFLCFTSTICGFGTSLFCVSTSPPLCPSHPSGWMWFL